MIIKINSKIIQPIIRLGAIYVRQMDLSILLMLSQIDALLRLITGNRNIPFGGKQVRNTSLQWVEGPLHAIRSGSPGLHL